ncbi:MAG: hypothetical protein LBV06_08280 [Propionibacteriaceae bacterium]|jgi:hypothetical protein|nr:hypothetical protein [Propionibacteriaceae bacterium]
MSAAALVVTAFAMPTANAVTGHTMTVTPAGWVAADKDFVVSGTDCVAPNKGSAEVVLNAGDDMVVRPAADGTWSATLHADGYGKAVITAKCVMYDEAAPAAKASADVTATADGKTTFDYDALDYAFVGWGSDDTFYPGDTITITGGGYAAGETVTFTVDGTVIGTIVADAEGNINGPLKMPMNSVADKYTIIATGDQSGRSAANTVTPLAAPGTSTGGGTTNTGGMPALGTDVI